MLIRKVALIGASGTLGPAVASALSSSPLSLTLLVRSSTKLPASLSSLPTLTVPDDFSLPALTSLLTGFDALVSTLNGSLVEPHKRLASAAAAAGVSRFIPADYGSVDADDDVAAELVPLYKAKREVRAHCEQLAKEGKGFSWTGIVCGHFFDFGLKSGLLGICLREGKATVFDGGEIKFSATTLDRVGDVVVRVLSNHADQAKDRMVFVQSFCVSQLDLIEAIKRTTGKQMEIEHVKAEDYLQEQKKKRDGGDKEATEHLVAVLGITRANWEGRKDFANRLLGLEDEDLDEVVKKVCRST